MTIGSLFHQLFISPPELLLEAIYGMADNLFGNSGLSIFMMSLVMNILLLPLYRQADAMQAEERSVEKAMEPYVRHIKKTFRGDERFMMLQTYYRQNHYKPYYTLRGSLPLVLEIPFFIAAYHFLSNLGELHGKALGPIRDLGAADGMIVLGTVALNLLPILMTLINIVSSAIYTKGFALKDKLTLYGMALIFLVLLYNSPAGLVFYWTLNNLFSLVKNLFYKLKNPRKVLVGLLSAAGAVLIVYAAFFYPGSVKHKALMLAPAIGMELPVLLALFRKNRQAVIRLGGETDYTLFLLGGVFLAILTGVLIPSAVIASSPEEFVQLGDFYSPLRHVVNAALCAAGTFVIWFGVFYYLLGKRAKRISELVIGAGAGTALVDYLFFGTGLGLLTANLSYENDAMFESGTAFSLLSSSERLLNLGVVAALVVITACLYLKKKRIVKAACAVFILAALGLSVNNLVQIQKSVPGLEAKVREEEQRESAQFRLSRNGSNVVVIMLDRAIGSYLPYLFQEKPELEEMYAGFTYYPNTLSYGGHTNLAAPALFGGYEYTPEELNRRTEEALVDKHNESLLVMPVAFDDAGYDVTVFDPPYAGYQWIPDLSIYNGYPAIHAFNTENGQVSLLSEADRKTAAEALNLTWKRNFFTYGVMKISPLILQPGLYQSGTYFMRASSGKTQLSADLSHAEGTSSVFMDSYAVLSSLADMTVLSDEGNCFLMMANSTTHNPALLKEPEYVPAYTVDNTAYDAAHRERFSWQGRQMTVSTAEHMKHYHVNMAALLRVGEWLDYLKENGVYDNTKIIIVSDHGYCLNQFPDMLFGTAREEDVMYFNPLLLVKDFNSRSFSTEQAFMTNADVPMLAMKDVIQEPVNPFTGNKISSDAKDRSEQHIILTEDWEVAENNGNTFLPGVWYAVHDSVFDLSNWEKLGVW